MGLQPPQAEPERWTPVPCRSYGAWLSSGGGVPIDMTLLTELLPKQARSYLRTPTVASPEPPRSTSSPGPEVLRGGSGEATVI